MKRLSAVFAVLTAVWCGVIFFLSAQPVDESSQMSGFFVDIVCDIFYPELDTLSEQRQSEILDSVSFIVRKGAHFTAYGILGALALGAFSFVGRRRMRALCAVGTAFVYACTDELHQYFVQGRSCELRDVMIDTSGAVLAVSVLCLIIHIVNKKRQRS